MRKSLFLLLKGALFTAIILQSCSKGGSSGGGTTLPPPQISASKTQIAGDGWETVTLTAKDQNNNDITSSCVFFVGNLQISGNIWWTNTPGSYSLKAVRSGVESSLIALTVTNAGSSPFSQKILVEDYTGTWCGHCPRVGIPLEEYVNTHPGTIVVANHGPSNDPYTFSNHGLLASYFQVTGYPSVVIDRDIKWNENATQLNTQFNNRRPPLGLSFQTTVAGNTISGTAKLKFDVNTSVPLKLVLYLVEDGKVYPQVNYNYYGLPNPISGYTHNGILRRNITDLYGEIIPVANQTKGGTYNFNFSVDATGYNVSKCRIVGFVVQGPNNQSRKENAVVNAQVVTAGQSKDFD